MRSLTVYCASSPAIEASFAQTARTVGRTLAERDIRLVYGGGSSGLMGEAASELVTIDSDPIAVLDALASDQGPRPDLSDLIPPLSDPGT